MRKYLIALAVAPLLSGCAAIAAVQGVQTVTELISSPAVKVVNNKVQLEGKRGLILASNAYQGASALLVPLINSDKLSPATVERISVLNYRVAALLSGADKTLSLAQRTAAIFGITEELNRIGGK